MPRTRNKLATKTVKVSTNGQVVEYLHLLVETGLYGKNASEAAERLIAQGVERLLASGTITGVTPKS